ncbi:MAG TPA: sugar phosphorylase [Thermoflexia bacterium]|nr:sugar phosphorylase [Thermoflexia bacterium]
MKTPFELSPHLARQIKGHLSFLYGAERVPALLAKLIALLMEFNQRNPSLLENVLPSEERLTERDAILITYGDQISEPGCPPLQSLAEVLEERAEDILSGVHILPCFPYSSDDGFSIIDYRQVDPALGTWEDIERLAEHFRLMLDAVINHISRQSEWVQGFIDGKPEYQNFFITVEERTDLSAVVRPRAKPLLTPLETLTGEKLVWTTFGPDQIDLNFAEPELLLCIIEVLLLYVEKGAEIIRLDAIAYLWKTIGTSCIHLEETHRVVKLCRNVLDAVAPGVMLITETNVPHKENLSYFGDGTDEAQLVYQFSLPPLTLHALLSADASYLTAWAADLESDLPTAQTNFYNFLASHDGVGVRPVEGILPAVEVEMLAERVAAHGGHVSYKTNADGSQSPYELNISYFDALSAPEGDEPLAVQVARFMASQAIMLALRGVPAIYVHSLCGSRNYYAGVEETGRYRSINREKFRRAELEAALDDSDSLRARVFTAYRRLLTARKEHAAFHPHGSQQVWELHPALFALTRTAPDASESLLCLHNVAGKPVTVQLAAELPQADSASVRDIISDETWEVKAGRLTLTLEPYQVLWLA